MQMVLSYSETPGTQLITTEARSLVPIAHCMGSKYWVDSATGRNAQELNVSVVTCNFSITLE